MNKKELTEIVRNQDELLEEHCAYLANINRAMGRYRNEGASLLDATKKIIAKLEEAEKEIAKRDAVMLGMAKEIEELRSEGDE